MKLLIHPAVDDLRMVRIRDAAGSMHVVNAEDFDTAIGEIVDVDAFFGKLTPQLLRSAQQLRWVQAPTASLEHYVFDELISHPCTLTNMRGLYSDVIADHVMGLVICFARNFHTYLRQQQQNLWAPVGGESARSTFTHGPGVINAIDLKHQHLADCTLGLVGAGAIGSEVARRGAGFGMRILAVDPQAREIPGISAEIWPPNRLSELLAECDFVVITAPHTPDTEKLFRKAQFEQMKPSAYLINIGRGAIVDLTDLCAALQDGTIAGAGLDVFEIEPLPASHPLWKMENVIITPHVAGTSPRIAERHTATLLENIRRFATGEPLLNVVDKRRWY